MNRGGKILDVMAGLIEAFAPHCKDRSTLDELAASVSDHATWRGAHALFQRIRIKTNRASASGDQQLEAQYLFEEACAKTLYNLGRFEAPFDPDSPFWILPNALVLAQRLGIPEHQILRLVAA